MKAIVCVRLDESGKREACLSVDWEAQCLTGLRVVCRLKEPLPLGIAEECCRLFNGRQDRGAPEGPDRALSDAAEAAWTAAGEKGRAFDVERERGALIDEGRSGGAINAAEREQVMDDGERKGLRAAAEQAAACLRGRSLLREEAAALLEEMLSPPYGAEPLRVLELAAGLGAVRLAAAIAPRAADAGPRRQGLRCRRCGSGEERMRRTRCASCGRSGCAVCEACATLGRSRECELLALGAEQPGAALAALSPALTDRWGLSAAQRSAAEEALRFLRGEAGAQGAGAWGGAGLRGPLRPLVAALRGLHARLQSAELAAPERNFLLWAVTGAGKTEMFFPLVAAVLGAGGRVLIATPRRDVVLELAPRLRKAFPEAALAVLYGGSEDRWANAELTLATTHQLLRFQGAFDLVLLDELDAFPYHNDPVLHYAAAKARSANGATVLLSATPPAGLRREVRSGRTPCARVPVRYHRHPLPVPARLRVPAMAGLLARAELPRALVRELAASVSRGAQVFVFVPYIKHVVPLVRLLKKRAASLGLEKVQIEGTYSSDPERTVKVQQFRQVSLRLLVTTTILERGVTIPRSDVFILGAHQTMFDEASLVQMAGRAGRSADDPFGRVRFCSPYLTRAQRSAVSQIRAMNRLAGKRGYLRRKGERA